jgi:ATP-dependent Clp protease ATP-binding subunit ClpB
VDAEEIAEIVARWTGIPVTRCWKARWRKLLRMEDRLHERVVGQEEAIRAVSNAVRRARAGLQDPNRPIGSFIFLGPTGVGKTELARALAEFLFDDERAMIRIDMSEYQEKHTVSRLIGAPPGYIGYEEGGQLTESVRRRPTAWCCSMRSRKPTRSVQRAAAAARRRPPDRWAGAHGRLPQHGRHHDQQPGQRAVDGRAGEAVQRDQITRALQAHFRPEFLNRIDEIVIFRPLTREDLTQIVQIQLSRVAELLRGRGFNLEVTPLPPNTWPRAAYDPDFGARPLKRAIQREVQDPLAGKDPDRRYLPDSRRDVMRLRCRRPCGGRHDHQGLV